MVLGLLFANWIVALGEIVFSSRSKDKDVSISGEHRVPESGLRVLLTSSGWRPESESLLSTSEYIPTDDTPKAEVCVLVEASSS